MKFKLLFIVNYFFTKKMIILGPNFYFKMFNTDNRFKLIKMQ